MQGQDKDDGGAYDANENFLKTMCSVAVIFDVAFGVTLLGFTIGHLVLVRKNQTSLEGFSESHVFDLNWVRVCTNHA